MDVFRNLTRGISFNTKRFKSDAEKFGLAKKEVDYDAAFGTAVKTEVTLDDPISPPDSNQVSEEEEQEDEEDEEEEEALTLLGDIKAKTKKPKKKRKEGKEKLSKTKRAQMRKESVNHFRNVHRLHVSGEDVPEPIDTWDRLKDTYGVSAALTEAVKTHYAAPTPIQMQAIPMMMEKREVLACAPTGSGKTAAYLIPLIHLLARPRKKGVRVVIIAPTRELAQQIHREAARLGECLGVRAVALDAVGKKGKKFSANKYDIVVSTPNKLVYMLKDGEAKEEESGLILKSVEWLIVDESDKLFESGPKGFRDQLAVIYRACEQANVRRGMFSATLAVDVEEWCRLNLDNVLTVTVGARNTATTAVEQKLVYTGNEKGKLLAFKQLIDEGLRPPVLVFVQTKERAQELLEELLKKDLKAEAIHSERSQLQRDNTVKAFRSGRVWVLICTELMGRGVDFKGVNLVVNYDFPPSTVSYIHRIGRTGRAGRTGKAVTFFTDQDKVLLRSIATIVRDAGGEVPDYMLTLKKASRQEKRRLAKSAVVREGIRRESKFDKAKRKRKEEMIAASKRRKRKAAEEAASPQKEKKPKVDKENSSGSPNKKKKTKKTKKAKQTDNVDSS